MNFTLTPPFGLRRSLITLATILCTAAPAIACGPPPGSDALQSKLAEWVNAERASAGLGKLTPSAALNKAAQFHACNMVKRDFFAHDAPGGPSFSARLKRQGYRISTAVENIGRSTEYSLAAPIRMWKNSPKHVVNTLDPQIREMGLGMAVADDGRAYYVFIGGAPR